MNVLGLLLHGFLVAVLQEPKLIARVEKLQGNVCLRAGTMWATLCFDGRGVEIVRGRTAERRAAVEGDMPALLQMVTGQGIRGLVGMVPPVLRRRVRLSGDLLFLLRLLPVLTGGGG